MGIRKQRGSGRGGRMTEADYAKSIATAFVIVCILAGAIGIAYWLNQRYDFRTLLQIPAQVPDIAIPIGLGAGAFMLLLVIANLVAVPFIRNPREELDEYGMYKHRDYD
jgi:TRAP-type C4-dicarboxylate transport system permease small subunit